MAREPDQAGGRPPAVAGRPGSSPEGSPSALLSYGSAPARWTLLATVLASALAFIDATVVNIALPHVGRSFGAGAEALQWTINAYTLTLTSFILLGGSLGDRFGRRRVFTVGVAWFAAASLLCGAAPGMGALIAARALQGIGGALLTPGSLAILEATFRPEDRARAIGAWSGLGGIAGALGPFLGGWLVQVASWRLVFLINVPLAAVVMAIARRHVPESRNPGAAGPLDAPGVIAAAIGLGGITYGFTAWTARGPHSPAVLLALGLGVAGLAAFALVEHRSASPMLPLRVFRSRTFTAANLATFAIYAALGGVIFLVVLQLQVVAGFGALSAGTMLLPITILMLLFSARAGALSQRIGPRLPMTLGPVVCAFALLLLSRIGPRASYSGTVLPAVVVLGLGLSLTVAPLTSTVLGSLDDHLAGVASGVNNAVARAAGLLAVAVLPLAGGLGSGSLTDPRALGPTFHRAMLLCAALLLVAAAISLAFIPGRAVRRAGVPPAPPRQGGRFHRGVAGPPLRAPEGDDR